MSYSSLPIMEHFNTLQGEGNYSGAAAYFIRLALCDVGCVWCDVKESWEIKENQYLDYQQIAQFLGDFLGEIVVVTGGEPTLHDLSRLTLLIHQLGKRSHIETAGTNALSGDWDWVTLSPKKFKACLPENFTKANELKVVIFHPSDFEWAEELAAKVSKDCLLYLQPEWGKRDKNSQLIVEYIKKNPKWRLSVQSHKFVNIP